LGKLLLAVILFASSLAYSAVDIAGVKYEDKSPLGASDWLPEGGTRLSINGKQLGKDIAGEDFYRALLRIWLGSKPAQDDLKELLLGKLQ
jgi:hypothetical protein